MKKGWKTDFETATLCLECTEQTVKVDIPA